MRTAAAAEVHRRNTQACLDLLRAHDSATVSELVAASGLSRPTVDAIVDELIGAGIAGAATVSEPRTGRPGRQIRFAAERELVAGIDAGPHTSRILLADLAGAVRHRITVPTKSDAPDLEHLLALARDAAEGIPLRAAGLAVPGIVHGNRLTLSRVIPSWNGTDLAALVSEQLGCPALLDNDVKAAAFAEGRAARAPESLVFVWFGRRISSAVVLGGELLRGSHGLAGEITAADTMRWTPGSVYGEWDWAACGGPEATLARAEQGEGRARAVVDAFAAALGASLAPLVAMIDPDVVVAGGGSVRRGSYLLARLAEEVRGNLTSPDAPPVRLARVGAFGAAAGVLLGAQELPAVLARDPWVLAPAADRLMTSLATAEGESHGT